MRTLDRRWQSAALLSILALGLAGPAHSDTNTTNEWLRREIIGPQRALAEVQDYTEARVPAMPEVTTVAEWERRADQMRRDVLRRVVFRGEAARWRDAKAGVEWVETIDGGPGYRIKKLRYEAIPGLWIPALLYEPEKLSGKVPVALHVNGHDRALGKAVPYKQVRSINLAKRGMLVLNVEWVGMGQLYSESFKHYRMNQIDLCGTSGLAVHYLALERALDLLLAHDHADPKRVAVAGLSGGGWQTIFISSLDTRVTLANPVAGYSSFRTRAREGTDLGDSEQTPVDLAAVTDYAHLTAMMAPRATLLTYNAKDDCCFASGHALPPLLEAAQPIFKLYGKEDNLRSHVNHDPGTHNFERDNREALYKMIGDHFFDSSTESSAREIPCDSEVKTREQLDVPLPEGNADFHTLALALSRDLPRQADLPGDRSAALQWREERAKELEQIVRAKPYRLLARQVAVDKKDDHQATFWTLRIGQEWTVPAVELVAGKPMKTAILVADGGRASAGEAADKLLAEGYRVVAVDPFYFGESKIADRDFLYALLISAVGDRPLGLQASQLAAVARWLKSDRQLGPVTVVAVGPRSSVFSLVSAGLEREAVGAVRVHDCYTSLKQVIEENRSIEETPELFCFGLLEKFDIRQLAALVSPREVSFVGAALP